MKIYGTSETTWKSYVSEVARRNQRGDPARAVQPRRRRDRHQAGREDRPGQAAHRRLRGDHPDRQPRPPAPARPPGLRQDRRRPQHPGLVALADGHQDLPLHALSPTETDSKRGQGRGRSTIGPAPSVSSRSGRFNRRRSRLPEVRTVRDAGLPPTFSELAPEASPRSSPTRSPCPATPRQVDWTRISKVASAARIFEAPESLERQSLRPCPRGSPGWPRPP